MDHRPKCNPSKYESSMWKHRRHMSAFDLGKDLLYKIKKIKFSARIKRIDSLEENIYKYLSDKRYIQNI